MTSLVPLALLVFSLSCAAALARPRDHDGDLRAPPCNQAAVNACNDQHRQAATQLRASAGALEPELAGLARAAEELRRELEPLSLRRGSVAAGIEFLERELAFLRASVPGAAPLLGGRFSVEELAALTPLQKKWGERYPDERARLLDGTISRQREQEAELKSRIAGIEPLLASKNNEFQSALSRKNKWLQEAREHDAMCGGGCKNDLCPLTN